ncbi:MAG: hypothetical protein PVG58_08220, partial [Gammaproteobacteria bacterium]
PVHIASYPFADMQNRQLALSEHGNGKRVGEGSGARIREVRRVQHGTNQGRSGFHAEELC